MRETIRTCYRSASAALLFTTALAGMPPPAAGAQEQSVELKVLVLTATDAAGNEEVTTVAFKEGLKRSLVPFVEVNLSANHTPITREYLRDGDRAKFQAVVLATDAVAEDGSPTGLRRSERAALDEFERDFKIRELVRAVYTPINFGLIIDSQNCGALPNAKGTIERAGEDPFAYLQTSLDLAGTWGCLASWQSSFRPLVNVGDKTVMGVFTDAENRERLALTIALGAWQTPYKAIFRGMLNWLTRGVHVGFERNYFAVHIDDVLLDTGLFKGPQCTDDPCDICTGKALMTPEDVDYLVQWQDAHRPLYLDIVFNGKGFSTACKTPEAISPHLRLGNELIANRQSIRFISHTFSHAYLGCETGTEPKCDKEYVTNQSIVATDTMIQNEIQSNVEFYEQYIVDSAYFSEHELVTGGHSGLNELGKLYDNKFMGLALARENIRWIGSDSSLAPEVNQRVVEIKNPTAMDMQRQPALTVPRYPTEIYFDVATQAGALAEYNSLESHTVKLTEFKELVELEASNMLSHILSNSPMPHYVHQANIASASPDPNNTGGSPDTGRILYPVLSSVLDKYKAIYGESNQAPGLVNYTQTDFGRELQLRATWKAQPVTAVLKAGQVIFEGSGAKYVPLTVPNDPDQTLDDGTQLGEQPHLSRYAGSISGWQSAGSAVSVNTAPM